LLPLLLLLALLPLLLLLLLLEPAPCAITESPVPWCPSRKDLRAWCSSSLASSTRLQQQKKHK
jgi:hypothetical protein